MLEERESDGCHLPDPTSHGHDRPGARGPPPDLGSTQETLCFTTCLRFSTSLGIGRHHGEAPRQLRVTIRRSELGQSRLWVRCDELTALRVPLGRVPHRLDERFEIGFQSVRGSELFPQASGVSGFHLAPLQQTGESLQRLDAGRIELDCLSVV